METTVLWPRPILSVHSVLPLMLSKGVPEFAQYGRANASLLLCKMDG